MDLIPLATFVGGAAVVGSGAYAFQQWQSGNRHEEQQRLDHAIAENAGKPGTLEVLRDKRPSDFDVNFDKSLVLGVVGGASAAAGALLLFAGGMSTIPEILPRTGFYGAVGLGILGGTVAGVLHNTVFDRFD